MTLSGWCAVVATRPDSDAVRRLVAALEGRGLRSRGLRADALSDTDEPPVLIVCRLASGCPQEHLALLVELERRGIAFLNRPTAVKRAHHKLAALEHLAACGLPVPPTVGVSRNETPSLDALPGARFEPGELLVALLTEQAADGSYGVAEDPAARVETTLDGLHALQRFQR